MSGEGKKMEGRKIEPGAVVWGILEGDFRDRPKQHAVLKQSLGWRYSICGIGPMSRFQRTDAPRAELEVCKRCMVKLKEVAG